ncbi:methyl-coenzyme M reductase operon protein D, partial [Methanosalsum natronophilum]
IQIEIFPKRLLGPERAQKLLLELNQIEGILRAVIQGPRLPLKVPYGPATGENVLHPDRKIVQINDTTFELAILVGRIRMEIRDFEVKERVREVCEDLLPFGFEFREGTFIAKRSTVSDYAKRGPDADPNLRGLFDPKASLDEQICFLNRSDNDIENK